jgi:hypothetical protein
MRNKYLVPLSKKRSQDLLIHFYFISKMDSSFPLNCDQTIYVHDLFLLD